MQRVLFFFPKSEEDTIALGEDNEGELKKIYQMKDKDGILIAIALREKLLSVMLFMAHFFLNLPSLNIITKDVTFFNILS